MLSATAGYEISHEECSPWNWAVFKKTYLVSFGRLTVCTPVLALVLQSCAGWVQWPCPSAVQQVGSIIIDEARARNCVKFLVRSVEVWRSPPAAFDEKEAMKSSGDNDAAPRLESAFMCDVPCRSSE